MPEITTEINSERGIISRPDLVKKLRTLSARGNIFITAPGGYGKSVAAAQWLASLRGKTAKLMVDKGDNNRYVFFRRLAQALGHLTGVETSIEGFTVAELVQMPFPVRHARCYLLIDDLHRIESEEVFDDLLQIAARLPEYICLCIVSRSAPPEAFMATGLFAALTRDALLFSPEEVEWLSAERGCSLTNNQIRSLLDTTGGWAMYLSALLAGGQLDGTAKPLLHYLETRLWDVWDEEIKGVLLRLAVPETVTPELCERLTGRKDGRRVLERLIEKENAFLSRLGYDLYQFHDIFRGFLLSRAEKTGSGELRRLHDIVAAWYFEQGDYLASTSHYIKNLDQEGISRCMAMTFQAQEKESTMSVEMRLHFTVHYIMTLPEEFIAANPYLLTRCALAAYHDGNIEYHLRYTDLLYRIQPLIASRYPDLAIICKFMGGIDPRLPLREHIKRLAAAQSGVSCAVMPKTMSGTGTITQNLPIYHRSIYDFSEYHELNDDDLMLFRNTLGVFMGGNNAIYEQCLWAGIHYEKGDLFKALHHALNAYYSVREDTSQEAFVSANALLSQALYAMGATPDAKRVLEQTEARLNEKARYLIPNLKAIQFEQAVRAKDTHAAREWLDLYALRSGHLPFYQIPRYFTTLRSYIALEDFASAIQFGGRLQALAEAYGRPLDQMESAVLIALALRSSGETESALEMMQKAVALAAPYDFVQLFINEGKEILPLLLPLLEKTANTPNLHWFIERLCAAISGYSKTDEHDKPPRLSAMRSKMLAYLEKGLSYGEIAAAEGIAHGTAKRHILLLYKQMGVHNAAEAVAKAKMMGSEVD